MGSANWRFGKTDWDLRSTGPSVGGHWDGVKTLKHTPLQIKHVLLSEDVFFYSTQLRTINALQREMLTWSCGRGCRFDGRTLELQLCRPREVGDV